MKVLKDEDLQTRLLELREEKSRLTDAFVSGRIPQDVYKKTVMRIEKEIGSISEEMRRRTIKRQDT